MIAERDRRSFNPDFQIVFLVRHRINRVVGKRPQSIGGKHQPRRRRHATADGGKRHRNPERKRQPQIKLRQREKTFGKGVSHRQKQRGNAHHPSQQVQRRHAEGGKQAEDDGQQNRFRFRNQPAGKGAVFRALDRTVKIAVGKVVDHAACAAHKERTGGKRPKNIRFRNAFRSDP